MFLAAARVGGIIANSNFPVDFLRDNLLIGANTVHAAHVAGTRKFLFLGSSCIYPKFATQPIREDSLLTGELEPTNQWYSIAKIAGIKMCQAYRRQHGFDAVVAMPTNLYGPHDRYDKQNSHVIPAMIMKFHEAKVGKHPEVVIWGTGSPRREFLYVDDLADAAVLLMREYDDEGIINVGSGIETSIRDLALAVKRVVGYEGDIVYDIEKPDGAPRKLLDCEKLQGLGWKPSTGFDEGLEMAYRWFLENIA